MGPPEAQALVRIAVRDLKAAKVLQDPAIDEASWGFHIQQTVEKALKAWLLCLGTEPPLIHNLTALLEAVADAGGVVQPFLALEAFTVFAVQFRYDAEPLPMDLDRKEWQQRAEELVHAVELIVCTGS